jgi:hypothetical protein
MKNLELEQTIESAIRQELPTVPINCVVVTMTHDGRLHNVCAVLNDDAPGWRIKDQNPNRKKLLRLLKRETSHLKWMKFHTGVHSIRANYSCLSTDGALLVRRDDIGQIIGGHA